MDDLLSIASGIMEGFNPATDPVDNFENVADGEYNCLLEKVTYRENAKGTKWVSFDYSIIDGEEMGRHIFVNYFFSEKMLETNIKKIIKVAFDFGYELPQDVFTSYEVLADYLNQMAGNQATVKQTTSKNGFANHTVTPAM